MPTDTPAPAPTPQTPWMLEVLAGGLATHRMVQRFLFRTEAEALSVYRALGVAKAKREARENDWPKVIEVIDAYGIGAIDTDGIGNIRVVNAAAWSVESATHERIRRDISGENTSTVVEPV